MHVSWLPLLRCPVTASAYDVDTTRETPVELIEGFLTSRQGREVRPVLSGIPVLVRDLGACLRTSSDVYRRIPIADSRVARFVLGRLGIDSDDFVPFGEVVRHYQDLVKPGLVDEPSPMDPTDATLARLLGAHHPGGGRGLDVGCGVGRSAFVLRDYCDAVLGVDRSAARVRRARNVAATRADFFLPGPGGDGPKELPLELSRLERRRVDFGVAEADALPLVDAAVGVVVLRSADGRGPLAEPGRALAEALRVLEADGLLVTGGDLDASSAGWSRLATDGGWTAWRRP